MIEDAASGKSSSQIPAWRFYFWGAVAALFAWAAWQRFALPLDPIADPGTWGYLSPALRKLLGAEFGHTNGRNFIYPAFLLLLVRVFGDFRAIVIAQHLLGLMAGGILLLTWRRVPVFVPNSRLSRAGHDGLGLLAALSYFNRLSEDVWAGWRSWSCSSTPLTRPPALKWQSLVHWKLIVTSPCKYSLPSSRNFSLCGFFAELLLNRGLRTGLSER